MASVVRTEYGPASEDDLPDLGRVMMDDLSPMTPALFKTQESTLEERYDWYTHFIARFYYAMADEEQRVLRGAFPTHVWCAKQFYSDGSSKAVGLMVFALLPRHEDADLHARLARADAALPPLLPYPRGFDADAFNDMFAATEAWTRAHFPTHSVAVVYLFAVDRRTRGTGVGARLLGHAKTYAAQATQAERDTATGITTAGRPGVPLALHAVHPARGFYRKQGLRDVGDIDLGRCNQRFTGMVWQPDPATAGPDEGTA